MGWLGQIARSGGPRRTTLRARKRAAAPGFAHALRLDATTDVVLEPPPDVTAALAALITDEALDAVTDWSLTVDDEGIVLTRVPDGQPPEETTLRPDGVAAALAAALRGARRAALSSLTRLDHLAALGH